ncbi:copper resistance D family protein [Mycolicibacterium goodii]|uniref:Copper resistance protein CopD n=1 Tax=Mycolicibacterium goodii TaxID=134601 RepID=A0A0K0X1E5_MYCGD|nr:copper resistance protein CopD [Mycolicibacterium goodii]
MGGQATVLTRRSVAGGGLVVAAASVIAWALAYPQSPLGGSMVRALADSAAVVTLGLACVPFLDDARHRADLGRSAARPLAAAAAVWAVAELVRLVVVAAQAAGMSVQHVGVRTVAEFAWFTAVGRSGLVSIVAALAVCGVTLLGSRVAAGVMASIGLSAAGMAARTLAGHLAESPLGGLAVAVHALAAALWCGVLAALVLTVTHRGQWARVLPRFSQLALGCVAVLLVAGTVGALVRLQSPIDLVSTGYGRLLTAKIVVTVGLMVLAWRNRAGWLPAARAHRSSAGLSRRRSLIELAVMTVVVTFAAALAVTG